jgi:murein DD-endopeptidase MepM/ murein hydrolase activator NlpD
VLVSAQASQARLRAALLEEHAARMARVATVAHPVARGETLAGILARYGIATDEIRALDRALGAKSVQRKLHAGDVLTLGFNAAQRILTVSYDVDLERRAVVERVDARRFAARIDKRPIRTRSVTASGAIRTSFYRDAKRAGIPDPIISSLVDLLAWEIDFSEVQRGDRFRVLYEEDVRDDGKVVRLGRVLAAELAGRAARASAFRLDGAHGESVYLDAEGHALDGGLLRYPVEFTRIASTFSKSRFHPILGENRPHLGVDFAAPIGTPVRAVGTGTVRWAGPKGDFGRHVEIDHGGGLSSAYSHLNGIASGLRAGQRVKRGQLVGWVGQSGLATGPHLHFAIFDKGRYVNPLSVHRVPQLAAVDRRKFERLRTSLTERLRAESAPAERGPVATVHGDGEPTG